MVTVHIHCSTSHVYLHDLQGNMGHRDQYGVLQKPSPWTATWLQVAAQIADICMAFCGNTVHGNKHSHQTGRTTDPDTALSGIMDSRHQHGLRLLHKPLCSNPDYGPTLMGPPVVAQTIDIT